MKTIKQRRQTDCGVACVAMLAGVSYEEAWEKVHAEGPGKKTKTADLRRALQELGRTPDIGRRRSLRWTTLESLEEDALVMGWLDDGGKEYRHWIVWDAKARKPRDPYQRKLDYRPVSYLTIG